MGGQRIERDRKFGNILKWIAGIICVLIVAGTICVYFFLDSFLKEKITTAVYQSSGGYYNLEIKDLKAKFWSGEIAMKNVWLKPNRWNVHTKKISSSVDAIPNVNVEFDSVNIASIRWIRYLLNNKRLEIGKVLLDEPSFIIESNFDKKGIKQNEKNFLDLLPGIIAAFTGSLRIDEIYISNGDIDYDLYKKGRIFHQSADSIYLDLKSIVIDTASKHNALYSESAWVDIRNYKLRGPDDVIKMDMRRISGKIQDSLLEVDKIVYFRKDSSEEHFENKIHIRVDKVIGRGVDYGNLFREQKVFMRSMNFDRPNVDLTSSSNPIKKYKPDNDSSILDAVVPYLTGAFKIDTLAVSNGLVNYKISNSEEVIRQSANNIYLYFTRVLVDTSNVRGMVYAEDIQLKLKNFKFHKSKQNIERQLTINSLYASVKDSLLKLEDLFFNNDDGGSYLVKASTINSRGIDFMQMLREEKLNMSVMEINDPLIVLEDYSKKKRYDRSKSKGSQNLSEYSEQPLGPLSNASLKIRKLKIGNGNIRHIVHTDSGMVEHGAEQVELLVSDVRIDSASVGKSDFYNDFSLGMNNYNLKYHKQNFRIDIRRTLANSTDKSLKMENVRITQIRSFTPTQRYYFIDSIKYAKALGVNFNRFFLEQEVHARKVELHKMDLDIYLDEGKVVRPDYASKMPNEMMQSLSFYIRIDTIKFYDSDIQYVDQDPSANIHGMLSFKKIDALVYNFTNDKMLMTEGTPCVLIGKTHLMGEGGLSFRITMPLLSKDFDAYYAASIDSMSGDKFNSLLAFGGFSIKSGVIMPSEFQVEVNSGDAIGKLKFQYENLHVNVLDKHLKKSKLKSKVGNVIIKDSNPLKPGKDPEVVSIKGKRVQDDSFFYFLWRILKDGITETITRGTLYDMTKR